MVYHDNGVQLSGLEFNDSSVAIWIMQSGFTFGAAHFHRDVRAQMRAALRQDGKVQNE
jgi:membrane protein required for beta-lactamase induction